MSEVATNGERPATNLRPMPLAEKWIKEHREEYVGRWVALRDDVLIADGANYAEMRSKLPTLRGLLITPVF